MPMPWKKMKSQRLSQLVNDHLHKSQKRRDGSSLVVETGFPTSLVDLFIKNREKLKKTSQKKRQNLPITPLSDVNDPLITRSTPSFHSVSPSHSPVISPLMTASPSRSPLVSPLSLPLLSESMNANLAMRPTDCLDERNCVADTGMDANTLSLVVLKIFLVVVLALGTKRLTVGITISAFLLFFLEFVGKHARAMVKSEAKCVSESMIQRYLRLLRFKEVKLVENTDEISMSKLERDNLVKPWCSLKYYGSRCKDQEIQVVESNRYLVNHVVDEIQPEEEDIVEDSCFQYKGTESKEGVTMEKEESSTCEDVAESKRKSVKAKIKSKMKKFVPKKLRISRKERDSKRGIEISKEANKCIVHENESVNASELSSVSSRRYKEDHNMSATRAFVRVSDVSDGIVTKMEDKGEGIKVGLNWKYLVIYVIVLAGLICGRTFAVLLTVSWLLLLKLCEKLRKDT